MSVGTDRRDVWAMIGPRAPVVSATTGFDSSGRFEPSCNKPAVSRSLIERGLGGQ